MALSPTLKRSRELCASTQLTLAQCMETREELRRVTQNMRATLISAQAGLEAARRDLQVVTEYIRSIKDR